MKKRNFLVPLAVSLSAITVAAEAHTMDEATITPPSIRNTPAATALGQNFVLTSPAQQSLKMAYHQSHSSHSSHVSHTSHYSSS